MTTAFENLKKTFKFIGIATIVIISLYIVFIIGAIISAVVIATHSAF
jgi:hypothetical protein